MSKPPSEGGKLVTLIGGALPALQHIDYPATAEQRSVKAEFWIAFKSNPLCDVDQISPALVTDLTGHDIQSWLKDKHFWAWFSSRDSTKKYIEMSAERAAELAYHLLDPAVPLNDNARVTLIKNILEFAGRTPIVRKEIKWQDKEVAQMSEGELDDYIAKLTAQKRRKAITSGDMS